MFRFALAFLLTVVSSQTFAGINNPGTSSGGGLSANGQINIVVGDFSGVGGEWALRNFMKGFTPQLLFWQPAIMDSNGYPVTASLSSDMQGQLNLPPSQTTGATTWVLKWTGKAGTQAAVGFSLQAGTTVTCQGVHGVCAGNFINGSTASQTALGGTNGRIEFTFTGNPSSLTIKWVTGANFDGTLSNLILCRLSDEAGIDAAIAGGDASGGFNPDYITILKAARPKMLRFVNYENVNSNANVVANAAQLIPAGALSYYNHFDPTVWAGNVSGTNTYSISRAGPLVDGYTVEVNFVNAATGTPTFSIDSGVTNIAMADIAGAPCTGGVCAGSGIGANSVWTLVYNSLLNKWLSQPGDPGAGIPPSVLVNLANQVGADLWYNIPPHFTDAAVTSVANTIKGTLNNTAWYEYANEVWNFGYFSTTFARNMGIALNIPTSFFGTNEQIYGYYSLRVRQVMGDITTAYGANTNYRRVLASAQYDPNNNWTPYRLNGQDLNPTSNSALCTYLGGTFSGTCSGAPNYSAFPNRAVDFSDALAYAPYYQGAQLGATDVDYTFLQAGINISTGTNTNPVALTTASPHGFTSGQRVVLNSFTGGWAGLNSANAVVVTVTGASTFTVPFNASGFAAYSGNAGAVQRFGNELTTLLTAADNWASGSFATALNALDGDIRAGTNYGSLGTGTVSYFNGTVFPQWETVAASYDGAGRPSGKANLQVVMYEDAMQGAPPSAAACTTLAISSTYCGSSGKIANMLGVGASASANSYKSSSLFAAAVALQFNDFFAQSHSKYVAWTEIAATAGDQWALYSGDIYSTPWSSYGEVGLYHFP